VALTDSSAISSLITFEIQSRVLENLRNTLVYANRAYAEQATLTPGHDTASFVFIPDLSITTTTLTEGSAPTAVALTSSKVDVTCAQKGNLVDITDVAKVKSPVALVAEAAERVSRNAQESIDQITRDVIAAGGTAFYAGSGNAARADLADTDVLTAATLRKLRATMYKNKIMPAAGGDYLLIVTAEQGYDLRSDTATGSFIDVNKYSKPETLLAGELGRMEGFRVIEAQNGPTFASTATVHAAIAVGHVRGWGVADLQSLSIHHVAPGGDHSDPLAQSEKLGWKVMFGAAVLDNARYYRLESGATAL
jgi:N4-gp56 family major capsid protein